MKEKFIKAETIYGGVEVLKLYLKFRTALVVQKFEDSGVNIKKITLTNIYIYICFEKKSKHTHRF